MSTEQLFAKVDTDGDGKVTYTEFSVTIEMSPKHGPNEFQAVDKNKDNSLDQAEFAERMQAVAWYKLSRKSPKEYFTSCDKDSNGKLSVKEFSEICVGHIESVFPGTDKDKSGGLDLKEVTDFINKVISK
jgi:Secreted protein acidic and rich in cysteine Ca binding region/EF hand